MLRIIVRIAQLYFFCFCLFLLCCAIGGQERGVLWFGLISVTIIVLAAIRKVVLRTR